MAEIKFAQDYGYAPGAPFWITWDKITGHVGEHPGKDAAEAEAALLTAMTPGRTVHVLCCMATVSTDIQVVGTRFDPNRSPTREIEAAPDYVPSPPAFLTDETELEPI